MTQPEKWTRESALQHVKQHIAKQGPAIVYGHCVYGGEKCCAIGCLLPPDLAEQVQRQFGGHSVRAILAYADGWNENPTLQAVKSTIGHLGEMWLSRLQTSHDANRWEFNGQANFEANLTRLAAVDCDRTLGALTRI